MSHNGSKYFKYVNENKGMRLKLTGPMSIFYSQCLEHCESISTVSKIKIEISENMALSFKNSSRDFIVSVAKHRTLTKIPKLPSSTRFSQGLQVYTVSTE